MVIIVYHRRYYMDNCPTYITNWDGNFLSYDKQSMYSRYYCRRANYRSLIIETAEAELYT